MILQDQSFLFDSDAHFPWGQYWSGQLSVALEGAGEQGLQGRVWRDSKPAEIPSSQLTDKKKSDGYWLCHTAKCSRFAAVLQ